MQYTICVYKNLQQIAGVTSGYTFRESLENQVNGTISVAQAKNIVTNDDILETTDFTTISSDSLRNPFFLEYNDILLVSRSSGSGAFRSTVFASNEKNVIASSSLHIIRITDVTVLPKYISLYINSVEGQKVISQIVTGSSYLQSIPVKNLVELKIPIPPIHKQKSIIALYENIKQQEKILQRKNQLKKNIINASFSNLINK